MHDTKQRLLEAGVAMMLEHGYNALGIQQLLDHTGIPRGSFYHHFESKEQFALQALDLYMSAVHAALDATLLDRSRPPLERIRAFFEGTTEKYAEEGYLGCFLGALGQELSGASELFRARIEACFSAIGGRLAVCLEEARLAGDLPLDCDAMQMADVLVNCWEGAALRARLLRNREPLGAVLDFYFGAAAAR